MVAEVTGAGVAKALLGKDVLSDELPYVTGAIGLLGTRPSYELMRDCVTLLIVVRPPGPAGDRPGRLRRHADERPRKMQEFLRGTLPQAFVHALLIETAHQLAAAP